MFIDCADGVVAPVSPGVVARSPVVVAPIWPRFLFGVRERVVFRGVWVCVWVCGVVAGCVCGSCIANASTSPAINEKTSATNSNAGPEILLPIDPPVYVRGGASGNAGKAIFRG